MFWKKKKVPCNDVVEIKPVPKYEAPQIQIVENVLGEFCLQWISPGGRAYTDYNWTTLEDARHQRDTWLANDERSWSRSVIARVVE